MIVKVNSYSKSPSFGFAKLNDTGKNAAKKFGMQSNTFLNSDLYKKQGFFRKSALAQELAQGRNFTEICEEYGCSNIGKANAEFIESQILSGKSNKAFISSVHKEDLEKGFLSLYYGNYDNPDLSSKSTERLLQMIKDYIAPEIYIKNIGLIKEGADK